MASENLIRIIPRASAASFLDEARKGGDLAAKIVQRLGDKDAVIAIGKTRVRAAFTKGVPERDSFILRLERIDRGTVTFRMIDSAARAKALSQLLEMTLLKSADQHRLFASLGSAIATPPAGILDLNARLLGYLPARPPDRSLARLLNHLLRLGVDRRAVEDLAFLLADTDAPFRAVLPLFQTSDRGTHDKGNKRGYIPNVKDATQRIASSIEAIKDPSQRDECLAMILDLVRASARPPSNARPGEFAWHHEGEYRTVRFLASDIGWIISLEFSALGRIEILAREAGDGTAISVFCDSSEALSALEESGNELRRTLSKAVPAATVSFHNTAAALQKIVEIYSRHCMNSVLDVKV